MRSLCLTALAMILFALSANAQGTTEAKIFKLENRDAAELLSLAQEMVSPGGSASLDARTNAIVATGTSAQLEQLEKILAELDGALKQVALTVYVTEVDTALEQRYGLQLSGYTVMDQTQFEVVLDLLDRQQNGRIENYMTVTTMSGSPAYLQISTDKFVTLAESTNRWGMTDTVYERVPVGQMLAVQPRVKPDGSIDVALTPTVSRSGKGEDITTRTAATHVVVPNGGTIAIGGSATTQDGNARQGVPLIPLEEARQSTSQRVMIFLTATTETGTNMLPAAPRTPDFEDPEVVGPKHQVKNRDRTRAFR